MIKSEKKSFLGVAFETLGLPVFWGCVLTICFYTLINFRVIDSQLVHRYFTAHPVEYVEAALFFVGLSALFMKLMGVIGQFGSLSEVEIADRPSGGQPVSDVDSMMAGLREFPRYVRECYLVRRLYTMLECVQRRGTAAGLDDEMKHQSELDAVRQYEGYALVRIIVWATPMLGFLGTVIGITMALGNLSPKSLVATPEIAMEGLLAGLSVAFDTTALALTLSIILMFVQFGTNRLESELLAAVDARVERELMGRFIHSAASNDPEVSSVQEMSHSVLKSVQSLIQKQATIWEDTLRSNQTRWDDIMKSAGTNIESSMVSAFRQSIRDHANEVERAESNSEMRTERRWEQLQSVLSDNAQVMQEQQSELVKQGDIMLQAINASGEVAKMQHALNENIKSLTMLGNFDETIMSLSAAINLLNARLGTSSRENQVRLYDGPQQRRAA